MGLEAVGESSLHPQRDKVNRETRIILAFILTPTLKFLLIIKISKKLGVRKIAIDAKNA